MRLASLLALALALGAASPLRAAERSPGTPRLLWPLDFDAGLAASFGELRGDRLHTGIDLRTRGETGFPVRAAAAGAVVRVKEEWRGYGLSVYVAHAGGLITVYAHLERVADDLEARLAAARRERSSRWAGDVEVAPGQPVAAGEVIAWSGESGAGLPHLHFETRRGMDRPVDPFGEGLAPPRDDLPPVAESLTVEPATEEASVNGAHAPLVLPLEGARGRYRALERPLVRGPFRLYLRAYDRVGAENWTGLGSLRASLDGREIYRLRWDALPFAVSATSGVVLDLARSHGSPAWYTYRLAPLPGAAVPFAAGDPAPLVLAPGLHTLEVALGDAVTTLAPRGVVSVELVAEAGRAPAAGEPAAAGAARGGVRAVPGAEARVTLGDAVLVVGAAAPYAPVELRMEPADHAVPSGLRLLAPAVRLLPDGHPFRSPVEVRLGHVPRGGREGVYRHDAYDGSWSIEEMGAAATVRRLGTFALLADEAPPELGPISPSDGSVVKTGTVAVVVRATDLGSGIPERGVRVLADGRELDPVFDPDRGRARAAFEAAEGAHELRVRVTDRAGNTVERAVRVSAAR